MEKSGKKHWEILAVVLAVVLLLVFFCFRLSGDVYHAAMEIGASELYTEQEIRQAEQAVQKYFRLRCIGGTLERLYYGNDWQCLHEQEWRREAGLLPEGTQIMVIYSDFRTGAFPFGNIADGTGVEKNRSVSEFYWMISRQGRGNWAVIDRGYI